MDKWLKCSSLKRKQEQNTSYLNKETEKVPGSNTSNNPANSVQITKKKNIKSGHTTQNICLTVALLWDSLTFQNINNSSIAPAKLSMYFQTNHREYKDKPIKFFQRWTN
jgi:hypothetical protein